MTKKIILIVSVLIVLFVAYFGWKTHKENSISDQWMAVPENAIAIIEFNDFAKSLRENQIPAELKNTAMMKHFNHNFAQLKNIFEKQGEKIESYFDKRKLMISYYSIKDTIQTLYITSIQKGDEHIIDHILDYTSENDSIIIKKSIYRGIRYLELIQGKHSLYITSYGKLGIWSSNMQLVFQSIDVLLKPELNKKLIQKKNQHQKEDVSLGEINLYIHFKGLAGVAKNYLKEEAQHSLEVVSNFSDHGFYDISTEKNRLVFSGFSHSSDSAISFIDIFKHQKPLYNDLTTYISTRTMLFTHMNISDPINFDRDVERYIWSMQKEALIDRQKFEMEWVDGLHEFYSYMSNSVYYALLENSIGGIDKVLYIQADKNIDLLYEGLKNVAQITQGLDSLQSEIYGNVPISYLPIQEFPALILGDQVKGFGVGYIAKFNDMLIVCNTLPGLKMLINDIESDMVWARSLRQNRIVEKYFSTASMSHYIDFSVCLPYFTKHLNAKGEKLYKTHVGLFKNINMLYLQVNNEEGRYYSNLSVEIENDAVSPLFVSVSEELQDEGNNVDLNKMFSTTIPSNVQAGPWLVKNHMDNSIEVLVQDSLSILYLIDAKGKILWNKKIGESILSDVKQFDMYRNHKLQYLFATKNKLWVVDRLGRNVEDFPKKQDQSIQQLSLFDYDNNKNYRILLSLENGEQRILDKSGKEVTGFDAPKINDVLAYAPEHIRAGKRDYLLFVQKDGKILLTNRRGELEKGFPIQLGIELKNSFHRVEFDNKKINSILFVTKGGQYRNVSSEGEIVKQGEIPLTSKIEVLDNSTNKQLQCFGGDGIYDLEGNKYLHLPLDTLATYSINWLISGEQSIYAIFEAATGEINLYDDKGSFIIAEPIFADRAPVVRFNARLRQCELYTVKGDKVALYKIKIPKK